MKLSAWAKEQGIHYNTAYNWFVSNKMPVESYKTETGTIMVVPTKKLQVGVQNIVIYGRVSSHDKKDDLARQIKRCEDFCLAKGYSISSVYKEIASGMNDSRKQLWRMIDSNPTIIIIENKDRLTRFGFEYISKLLEKQNCKIEIINQDTQEETDLIKDMIAVVTSFCCRLYGARRGQNKAKKFKDVVHDQSD